jgi:hypothetical protein
MNTLLAPRRSKPLLPSLMALPFLAGTACFAPSAAAFPVGAASENPCATAACHLAKAEEAHRAAATSRQDADRYRLELQKEKKSIAILPKAPENPWWRKARLHYEPLIESAERSAVEADRLAEYHRLQSAELQGR